MNVAENRLPRSHAHGRRHVAPTIPLGQPWRLTTGVVSYDGELHFGFTGGQGIGDRVHLVGAAVQQTLTELNTLTDQQQRDTR